MAIPTRQSTGPDDTGCPLPEPPGSAEVGTAPAQREAEVRERCELCGHRARVYTLEGYLEGEPVYHSLCLECAERQGDYEGGLRERGPGGRQHLSVASLLIVGGLVVGLFAALGDRFGIGGSAGFGWYQTSGVLIGAMCVLIGAFLHVDALGVFGTALFGLAICTDLLALGGSPGLGWKQQSALVMALLLIVIGLAVKYRPGRAGPRAGTERIEA